MVALRSWGMFSVPPFFPKMISQGAAKIGSRSKLVTENQLARASHQNHPFQKIGTLNDRPIAGNWPLLPTVLRAGARKGAKAGRRRDSGQLPFLKHGAWQKCLASLAVSQSRPNKSLTHGEAAAESRGLGKA